MIDADEAIINFGFEFGSEWDDIWLTRDEFVEFIKKQPTIEAGPVVRCKDCKYGEKESDNCTFNYFCRYDGCAWNNGDHFCGYGERKKQ